MEDGDQIVGHKTFRIDEICPETGMPQFRHEPLTKREADAIWEACEQHRKGCKCNTGMIRFRPHGCICPPGSEKTCQGWDCPRRTRDFRSVAFVIDTRFGGQWK